VFQFIPALLKGACGITYNSWITLYVQLEVTVCIRLMWCVFKALYNKIYIPNVPLYCCGRRQVTYLTVQHCDYIIPRRLLWKTSLFNLFKTPVAGEWWCSVRQGGANQGQWHEKTSSANNILRLLCVQKRTTSLCVLAFYLFSPLVVLLPTFSVWNTLLVKEPTGWLAIIGPTEKMRTRVRRIREFRICR
jgi:hypothetical protein